MKLSVAVPTRDRAALLEQQLLSLALQLDRLLPGDYEVLVGDNSTPEHASRVREIVAALPDRFRLLPAPVLLDTAEENLRRLLPDCRGEYVWFLSDDDGVLPAGLARLVEVVRAGEVDLAVFNSLSTRDERVPGDGPATSPRARRVFFGEALDWPLQRFLIQTGFFYYVTGFSTTLVRRSLLDGAVFDKYLAISRIYSHVAFLAEIGHGRTFRFINTPLVAFGLLHSDFDGGRHWRGVGVREGGFELSIWTTLWLRTLDELVRVGVFEREAFRFACEMNHVQRFYWPHMLAHQMIDQITLPGARVVGREDADHLVGWLTDLLPSELFLTLAVRRGFALTRTHGRSLTPALLDAVEPGAARDDARLAIEALDFWRRKLIPPDWFQPFYRSTRLSHDLYCDGFSWFAFPVGETDRMRFLEACDLPSVPPSFHRADTEAELLALLAPHAAEASSNVPMPSPWLDGPVRASRAAEAVGGQALGGQALGGGALGGEAEAPPPTPADYDFGRKVYLGSSAQGEADAYVTGFASSEPWGRWSDGPAVAIRFSHAGLVGAEMAGEAVLELWPVMAFAPPGEACRIRAALNGARSPEIIVIPPEPIVVPLPDGGLAEPGVATVVIEIVRPKRRGEPPDDPRALGVGLAAWRVSAREL